MIKARHVLLGAALVAAGSAGGSAITASNTVPDTTAGYGTSHVSGATVTSIVYTLSSDGTSITAEALTFSGDLSSGKVVKAGFESNALSSCTLGSYDSGSNTTSFSCSISESTSTAATFNVAVTNS